MSPLGQPDEDCAYCEGRGVALKLCPHCEASGKTFGLVPPPKLYERRPLVKDRYNRGRSLMAQDADGVSYVATCNTLALRSVQSSAWDECLPLPDDVGDATIRILLYEAAQAAEVFDVHVKQIQSARDKAHALTARVNALVQTVITAPGEVAG